MESQNYFNSDELNEPSEFLDSIESERCGPIHSPEQHAELGSLRLCYQRWGSPADPAVVMIMGLGGQLSSWPSTLCRSLVEGGYQVICFDNRDSGLSTSFDEAGQPRLLRMAGASWLRRQIQAPYRLEDMAEDVIGLLDHLQIDKAHVVGLSMGGMIAQLLAAHHPQRLSSLTCWMTTSGDPRLPGPRPKVKFWMLRRRSDDPELALEETIHGLQLVGSPAYPRDKEELAAVLAPQIARAHNPEGRRRQLAAIIASGSRSQLLPRIKLPSLILHGADDPLIPVQHALDLGRRIAQSRIEIFPGVGHDLPEALVPRFADSLLKHWESSDKGLTIAA